MEGKALQPERPRVRGRLALLTIAAALLPVAACDSPAAPGTDDGTLDAAMMVSANVIGTPIDVIVIEITGPGIGTPLVYNLDVVDDVASGTLRMPAGEDRHFDVRAYDDINEVTHEGSLVMDVKRGPNPPVSLPLVPRSGHVEINITMGDYSVVVDPASHDMMAGEVFQLTATVTNPDGSSVAGPVSWATLNPSIATVDADGNVTAVSAGEVTIVATFDGIGGSSVISVQQILGPVYPPPGGVTLATTGEMGRAGGSTWSFTGFDLTQSAVLAWGQSTDFPVEVALDGAVDAPGETLTFDAGSSDLPNGIMVWTGETTVHVWNGTAYAPQAVPTRITVTVSEAGTGLALEDAAAIGRPEIGGVVVVAHDYAGGTSLDAHVLIEGFSGASWQPVLDLYDGLNTDPSIESPVRTSFGGGFYYMALP